jgi:hypothetical protein
MTGNMYHSRIGDQKSPQDQTSLRYRRSLAAGAARHRRSACARHCQYHDRGWYDRDFIRNWSNGPLLVRADTGQLLTERDLTPNGEAASKFPRSANR